MKWVTVEEYAKVKGITKAGAYKRIKLGTAISEKKFGKIVIKLNGKSNVQNSSNKKKRLYVKCI